MHFTEDRAAVGFIAERPYENRSVILVSFVHAFRAVKNHFPVLFSVARDGKLRIQSVADEVVPHAVCLQIRLINDIQSEQIAQAVKLRPVRIMARSDRVDVIAFHCDEILPNDLLTDHASALRTEFMAVDALKYNALTIEIHDAVADLKAAESHLLCDNLALCAECVEDFDPKIVEMRCLGAPQFRCVDCE